VLSSTANGQLQSQHEYKQQHQYDSTGQNEQKQQTKQQTTKTKKMAQLTPFTLRHELLKISVH
jgi:hypothetical protein